MANNISLKFVFWLGLLISASACTSLPHRYKGEYERHIYSVDTEIKRYSDSLRTIGVDTLFVYDKNYNSNVAPDYIRSRRQLNKGISYYHVHDSHPQFIFWQQKGEYFVGKIDKGHIYPALKRPAENHFALFDYFLRVVDTSFGKFNFNTTEYLTIREKYTNFRGYYTDTIFKIKDFPGIEKHDDYLRYKTPYCEKSHFIFITGARQIEKELNESIYNPVMNEESYRQLEVKMKRLYDDEDSIMFRNDPKYYQLFRTQPEYIWTRMVESELFSLEMMNQWHMPKKEKRSRLKRK